MDHMWSLITSTVLDSDGEIPGDDDDGDDDFGDDVGDVTVVRDGDCFEAVAGFAEALSTSGNREGGAHDAGGANGEVAPAEGEQDAIPSFHGQLVYLTASLYNTSRQ